MELVATSMRGTGGLARDTARPNKGTPMSGGAIIALVALCVLLFFIGAALRKRSKPGDLGNPIPGDPKPPEEPCSIWGRNDDSNDSSSDLANDDD